MSIYKINERTPDLNQYCFVKLQDDWVFATYDGQEEENHKWTFFTNPTKWALNTIVEWQPAFLRLANAAVDFKTRKVTMDLVDVQNEERESMYDLFHKTVVGDTDVDTSRNCSDSQIGGQDVPGEIPLLRADCIEHV